MPVLPFSIYLIVSDIYLLPSSTTSICACTCLCVPRSSIHACLCPPFPQNTQEQALQAAAASQANLSTRNARILDLESELQQQQAELSDLRQQLVGACDELCLFLRSD